MPELVNRVDLLMSAIYCGGGYALWRVVLTVFYPFVSGSLWQNVLGPSLGQSKDMSRPSYLPTQSERPLVMSFGLFAASIDDLTHGIRDGLLPIVSVYAVAGDMGCDGHYPRACRCAG